MRPKNHLPYITGKSTTKESSEACVFNRTGIKTPEAVKQMFLSPSHGLQSEIQTSGNTKYL
jgi:hypothetical protein